MKRVFNTVYFLCFLLFLIIPLCLTNTESNVKSDLDNRVLVELPEFGVAGFEAKIKSYLQDRIGLRNQMVTSYQLLNNLVAGELTHPTYTYGRDGYMFFKMHSNISYSNYHRVFAEAVVKMKDYCESRGSKFYFLFDPEKISVYRRYLPAGVNYNDEWVDELITYLDEHGVNCVSNKDMLIERSFEEQVYNHQYDAGHWNDLGCFYGTNNLWKAMHEDFPSITEYTMDDFDITTITGQYLANSKYPVNESIPSFSLKSEWKNITSQYSEVKRHKNFGGFIYTVNTSPNADEYPKMLIFQGSYYNRAPQFFIGRSREYIGIHDYQNVLNLDYYFNIFQPEVVVFEVAEYTFSDTYFSSSIMSALDYNPSIIKENESIETAIVTAIENAEEYVIESESKAYLVQHGGFDSVYLEKDLSLARYVYLFTENMAFDLQKDDYDCYSAGIPHDAMKDKAILYYEDYAGKAYYSEIGVQCALRFVTDPKCFIYTDGAVYNSSNDQYEFITSIPDNRFSSVNMQLIDGITREYLGTINSVNSTGTFRSSFINKNETGWYLIRLKGNSNKHDEGVDVSVFLIKGKRYYYSFDVIELSKQRIKIKNYEVFGPSYPSAAIDPDILSYTHGASYNADNKQFEFTTDIEGNRFSAVNMQIIDAWTGEYLGTFFSTSLTGISRVNYTHEHETGRYLIRLKGNTNKQDESMDVSVFLIRGKKYYYSFDVIELSENSVKIKNYEMLGPSYPSAAIDPDTLSYTSGAAYDVYNKQFKFTTDIEDNSFNAVNIQLIDAWTGEYLGTIFSTRSTGAFRVNYTHEHETGLYLIRLKGNTNKQDEGMDFSINLESGKKYFFSFIVHELSEKEVILKDYEYLLSD